jgi:beta-lactamase class A
MRRRGAARAVGLLGIVAVLAAIPVVAPAAPAGAASCTSVFSAAFADDLAARYPGIRMTAAVHDTRTGCWYHLRPGTRMGTASVIKAQVLGAVLLRAQAAGRGLTSWERSQIGPMIRYSFNPETSNLYVYVGSEAGMRATDRPFGVTSTTHTARFGATQSTAADRTNVALRLLHRSGALAQGYRDTAWAYMSDVHPLQEWGISAGVPVGWSVAQKNGFYPSSGVGWRVGSSGFVRQDGGDQGYAITVMTEGATTQRTGIRLTEEIARRAAEALTVGPGDARPFDRARCVQTTSGESWTGVAARLGLPSSRAGEVRTVAGGNPSPLSGQLACSPDIHSEPIAPSSSVQGRYRASVSDLDCDGHDDLLWYGPGARGDRRWAGHADRRFRDRAMSVSGEYTPVAGDFDGDGCGDVLWYGAGSRPDFVWSGGGSVSSAPLSVNGSGYVPRRGDFDADGRDDVLWYRPGSGSDFVWFGRSAAGSFHTLAVTVNGAYEPVVGDLDGDGADDVYWYARGAGAESLWRGTVGSRGFSAAVPGRVDGAYRPVAADGDGDGADEITWYAPGPRGDFRWSGLPSSLSVTPIDVDGDYLPLAGDFDGDGRDDLAWYGPGGRTDWMWWGRSDGRVDSVGMARA